MKIYIAGKITGLPVEQARQKFKAAQEKLFLMGMHPVNPMELHQVEKSWNDYLVDDIRELMQCQAIYMLENWIHSRGARIEFCIAKEMGLKIIYENNCQNLVYRTASYFETENF